MVMCTRKGVGGAHAIRILMGKLLGDLCSLVTNIMLKLTWPLHYSLHIYCDCTPRHVQEGVGGG